MSKDINQQTAFRLFATTNHQVLWANAKGEFFTSENLGSMSLKADEKLIKFEREKASETETSEEKEYDVSAKDTIAKIKAIVSLEDLKAFETDERKSVKQVHDWKQKQLIAAINVIGSTTGNGNEDTAAKK